MQYQVRFRFKASTLDDFDRLIALENDLIELLEPTHEIDGHDFGEGEMTIFVLSNSPDDLLLEVKDKEFVRDRALSSVISYHTIGSDEITSLWPVGSK